MIFRILCLVLVPLVTYSQEAPGDRLYPVFLSRAKRVEAFIDVKGNIRITVDTSYEVVDTHFSMDLFHSGKCVIKKKHYPRQRYDFALLSLDGKIENFPPLAYVSPINGKFMMVSEATDKYAITDLNMNYKSQFVYENFGLEFSEGLATVTLHDSIGFVDESGALVLPPAYPKTSGQQTIYFNKYKEGKARYTKDGLIGFIDRSQRVVIPAKYSGVRDFSDGAAWVKLPDETNGFIDPKGNWIIRPTKTELYSDFGSGLLKLKDSKGLYGYVNKKGQYVIQPAYEEATAFERGYAVVKEPGAKPNVRKIIDAKGNVKYEGYFHFANFDDPYLILLAQEGIFAGYYAFSNNFIYIDYNFKPVWIPRDDQRVITSVEVLQSCDPAKVKWGSFTENVESIDDLQPYLSKMNLGTLALYPEKRLTTVPEEIMQMTNLVDLTLSFNNLESIPSSIGNLKNLKRLSLQFNNLKSLPPEIYGLKLKELDLRDNKFDLKTLLEIKSKMPGTKVIFKN